MYLLQKWDRLIPTKGVMVSPNLLYKDSNDVPDDERSVIRKFFTSDPAYLARTTGLRMFLTHIHDYTKKGSQIGRKYCIYVYHDEFIGCVLLQEILDNEDGYGKDDFEILKLLHPKFRGTKFARYVMADTYHFMFKSGIAKRLYAYVPVKDDSNAYFFDRLETGMMPCISQRYASDAENTQPYMSMTKTFKIMDKYFAIIECNGMKYNSMDLFEYMKKAPGRSDEKINRWLIEMDTAAAEIKKLVVE